MPQGPNATWLLVADGAVAQIYVVTFVPLHLDKLEGGHFKGNKARTRDLESDRPGTGFESVGGARHGIQRRSDAHQRQENHFIDSVVNHINEAAVQRKFGRIVIVAPPRALAELRRNLNPQTQKLVKAEISADWTKLPALDLLEHVQRHMAVPAD